MDFWAIKAELRENYKIYVEFNDGYKGVIDFENKLMTDHREIIRELLDGNKFKAIKTERHTYGKNQPNKFAGSILSFYKYL